MDLRHVKDGHAGVELGEAGEPGVEPYLTTEELDQFAGIAATLLGKLQDDRPPA
jgi:hypothetical protein